MRAPSGRAARRPAVTSALAGAALAFAVGMTLARTAQCAGLELVTALEVHNAPQHGGAPLSYALARADIGGSLYVDDAQSELAAVPRELRGQLLIRTASADAGLGLEDDLLDFTLSASALVYVAYDTRNALRPHWLTDAFLDSGQTLTVGAAGHSPQVLELYSSPYRAGARVRLGQNAGSGAPAGAMYSVIIVPTPLDSVAPSSPARLHAACATAAVVGLEWSAATDNVAVARYQIARDGKLLATVSFAQTQYADTSIEADRRYTYVVSAVDGAGNSAHSAPLRVRTPHASRFGDAAYCPSPRISSMRFDFRRAFSETAGSGPDGPPASDGSDLWPLTWGADGSTYAFFGDGWGLCGQIDMDPATLKDDYTSFGVARIAGPMPPDVRSGCPVQFKHGNLYGGYDSSRPNGGGTHGLVRGKLGALIALGGDFYGIGALWSAGEGGPGDSPNRTQIVYSLGDAQSWRAAEWSFCSADARGQPHQTDGIDGWAGICPTGFVNFGPGYAGAPDDFVYLFATNNNPLVWGAPGENDAPERTYLLRVARERLLDRTAYEYFAGLDAQGEPLWSENPRRRQAVFEDHAGLQSDSAHGYRFQMFMGIAEAVYDAPLGRYIATAQGPKIGQLAFYEALHPWGPWFAIFYTNIDARAGGAGGWGRLGAGRWEGTRYVGADSLGVHIGNAWTSRDGTELWLVFSSDGLAPKDARFRRLAGNWLDSFNLVRARLRVRGH